MIDLEKKEEELKFALANNQYYFAMSNDFPGSNLIQSQRLLVWYSLLVLLPIHTEEKLS